MLEQRRCNSRLSGANRETTEMILCRRRRAVPVSIAASATPVTGTTTTNDVWRRWTAILLFGPVLVHSLSSPAVVTRSKSGGLGSLRQPQNHPFSAPLKDHFEYALNNASSTGNLLNAYESFDHEEEDEGEENNWSVESVESAVYRFHRLQKSAKSEVLQSELQAQIDLGPQAFLNQQTDSEMEKIAMSSVTEQLPQAAVAALTRKNQPSPRPLSKAKQGVRDLDFSPTSRVSVERELQLARTIQVGVALYQIKRTLESQIAHGAPPLSRADWARAVGLSTKELRQTVTAYRQAKHDLVTANMGLVHAVVKQQYQGKRAQAAGVSYEELIQEGSLGLLRAAELFDPSRGLRFSTYAVVWIKGVLSNSHLTELVKLPLREKTKYYKLVRAQTDWSRAHGDAAAPMPLEQLAAATGLTAGEILETQIRMNQASNVLSLDSKHKMQSRSGTETGTLESNLESDQRMCADEANLVERTQLQADVIAAMARNLDAREARLMRLRFGLSDGVARTLQECADAMGLSYSRVYQLSQGCLDKLREADEAQSLEEYLLTIA
jgi:RNA polymerase sigma factor (sigma-70 family)